MANDTLRKFGDPATMVADYGRWRVLLRPAQVTLGALILGHKGEERAFADLPPAAFTELGSVIRDVEANLACFARYQRINYLMLMMVDPHVHFHVLPRYGEPRRFGEAEFPDRGWPGPPDLSRPAEIDEALRARIVAELRQSWRSGA
jgi:diadenosine tetraphosphate (Ap4A) HIT family hydrolase